MNRNNWNCNLLKMVQKSKIKTLKCKRVLINPKLVEMSNSTIILACIMLPNDFFSSYTITEQWTLQMNVNNRSNAIRLKSFKCCKCAIHSHGNLFQQIRLIIIVCGANIKTNRQMPFSGGLSFKNSNVSKFTSCISYYCVLLCIIELYTNHSDYFCLKFQTCELHEHLKI